MKPYALMLLIGAIVAFSNLVGRGEGGGRLPFIPAALRNIGATRAGRLLP